MRVYDLAPILIQNLAVTIRGLQYKRERFGAAYRSYLQELREREHASFEVLREYQDQMLVKLVNHAVRNSPFYQEFYSGIDITSISGIEDLEKLPILPKETVRSNIERMYTLPRKKAIISNTSGTTGTTMTFRKTLADHQKRMAYLDHFKSLHGFEPGKMKRASFTAARIIPPGQKTKVFWRDNLAIKQRLYSSYHCNGSNIKYYVDNIVSYKPDSIDGHPSALYEIARFILENDIALNFRPVAIFPTAETLLPHYREAIERAFKCPVRDQYASSEGAPFIIECPSGKLHYRMDTGIIEVTAEGDMLVTCFETFGTPLIRYDIGDRIVMGEPGETCSCGSAHPVVREIQGRGADHLISLEKGPITSLWLSIVSGKFNNSIKRMQFIQNKPEEIEVLIAVDERYKPEMADIIVEELCYVFGSGMSFRVKVVDDIPREPSGKYRLVKNNLL